MGNGIAHVLSMYGYQVSLIDISESALQRGMETIIKNMERMVKKDKLSNAQMASSLDNILTHTDLGLGVQDVDLVIEAATENEDIKIKIFQQLDELTQESTILATNTSSISITKIASATQRPDKVIGMHFMNPVPIMRLVEIIRAYSTSDAVTETIVAMAAGMDKVPVVVNDYPGFVANRILIPMINEAIYTLFEGVAGVEQIDSVMKLGMAHPMGPLQLADFIGLDVVLAISRVLHQGFLQPKYAPCPLLVNMVQAGKLGKKSGEGFYAYTKDGKAPSPSAAFG